MIAVLGKRRAQDGVGISCVKLEQGGLMTKAIDKKQLKRYIDDSIRKEVPLSFHPGL